MSFPGKLEQSRPRCDATLFCLFLLVFLSGFCIIAHFLSSPNFPSLFPIAQLLIIAKTLPSLPSFSRPTKTEGEWFSYADESLGVFFTKKKYSRFSDHKTSRKCSNFAFKVASTIVLKTRHFKDMNTTRTEWQGKAVNFSGNQRSCHNSRSLENVSSLLQCCRFSQGCTDIEWFLVEWKINWSGLRKNPQQQVEHFQTDKQKIG